MSANSQSDALERRRKDGVTWLEVARDFAEETIENGPSTYIHPDAAEAVAQVLLALIAFREQSLRSTTPASASSPQGDGFKTTTGMMLSLERYNELALKARLLDEMLTPDPTWGPWIDYPTEHPDRCRKLDGKFYDPPIIENGVSRLHWRCHKKAGHVGPCSTHNDGAPRSETPRGDTAKDLLEHIAAADAILSAPPDPRNIKTKHKSDDGYSVYEAWARRCARFIKKMAAHGGSAKVPLPHNFDPARDVACTKGEYAQLFHNARRYEWLSDNMRKMPLGEKGTRHFFDQSSALSFQEAVDAAMLAASPTQEQPDGKEGER